MRVMALLAITLSACGTTAPYKTISSPYRVSDPILDEFMERCHAHGGELSELCDENLRVLRSITVVREIVSESQPPSIVGICRINVNGLGAEVRDVEIKEEARRKMPPATYKALLFHEFGHCLLDLDHTHDPDDLMYPQLPEDSVIAARWDAMSEDLFEQALANLSDE